MAKSNTIPTNLRVGRKELVAEKFKKSGITCSDYLCRDGARDAYDRMDQTQSESINDDE